MSIDHNASLGLGWVFTREELNKNFEVEVAEEFHMEDRFDSKTGQKLAPVKVIDRVGGNVLMFEGEEMEDIWQLAQELADYVGGRYTWEGETYYSSDNLFVIGPNLPRDFPFEEISKLGPELERIGKNLESLKLDLGGPPQFFACLQVC